MQLIVLKYQYATVALCNFLLLMPRSGAHSEDTTMPNEAYEEAIIDDRVRVLHTNPKKAYPTPFVLRVLRLGFRVGGLISPVLTGNMAAKLWFTPTRFKTPASEQGALKSANMQLERIQDHDIATYRWSSTGWDTDEPIVLLVHGWSGRGTQLGSFVQPLLDSGFRVLGFDAPAHGKSSGKNTSIYEVAHVIQALSDKYRGFHSVITHSFGGMCVAYAITRGLAIKRLACVCPPRSVLGLMDKFSSTLHISTKTKHILKKKIEQRFGNAVWSELSMESNVNGLEMPGLIIHDEHDEDIPWQEGEAVSKIWTNARFIKTSNLGHRRILRDPASIDAVVNFIED
jgi:pimeloyl-ACP methyl ester carboxylesterase